MAEPEARAVSRSRWRPGDRRSDVASMIRVDQAGEFGATRIYAGQLAILGDRHAAARPIARMMAQEERHRAHFDAMLVARGVRPTLLTPLWDRAGHALGVVTALIGPEAAMACTAAVETEIDRHYAEQRTQIGAEEAAFGATVAEFQAEEQEHRETALREGAERAPAYPLLSAAIRAGCRVAIGLSKHI